MSQQTLWSLLNNQLEGNHSSIPRGILIPMIQRDYAQGRDTVRAEEIRTIFVNDLLDAIINVRDNQYPALELDFIYGYVDTNAFIPLDGQQRLTTLYLLHWYIAYRNNVLGQYNTPFSKFSYQTRKSSTAFFQKLNSGLNAEDYKDIFDEQKTFREVISNKNWYFVDWKYDLTIQSAITVLDQIHKTYTEKGLDIDFQTLIEKERPCIIFHYLNIHNYGITDDLYIKMNARGKPLTPFENLKAELNKFIQKSDFNDSYNYQLSYSGSQKNVDVGTYFSTKIDTVWTDYFWNIRDKKTNEFDDKLLSLLSFIAINELIKHSADGISTAIKKLKLPENLSFYQFNQLQLINEDSIITFINVLNLLVSKDSLIKNYIKKHSKYLDKELIISYTFDSKNVGESAYENRTLFYAITKFLIKHEGILNPSELEKWDRLIRNLAEHSTYDDANKLHNNIKFIDAVIAAYDGDIYKTFLEVGTRGFDEQQFKEEKLKIHLILKSETWNKFIHKAEAHRYLKGQIIHILSFSGIYDLYLKGDLNWNKERDKKLYTSAVEYFDKFECCFNNDGLITFEDELFRRALLTKGDFLIYSMNFSFLENQDRDSSWKRLLKESGGNHSNYRPKANMIKQLFDDLDTDNVKGSLLQVIKNHSVTGWRKDFIENSFLFDISEITNGNRIKYYDENNIYVLRKKKYIKKSDPELNALILENALIKKGFKPEEIELGFIDSLNQYGILRVKKRKPKVVYRSDSQSFLIRRRGNKDEVLMKREDVINRLVDIYPK